MVTVAVVGVVLAGIVIALTGGAGCRDYVSSEYLLPAYYMAGTVLSAFYEFSLNPCNCLIERDCYYSHFPEKKLR